MRKGYRVVFFYRAWHYNEWSSTLFKEYVRTFVKLKVESSNFPQTLLTNEDKQQWAKTYEERLGIKIDLDNVKFNSGMRHIAKILLNSLVSYFFTLNKFPSQLFLLKFSVG